MYIIDFLSDIYLFDFFNVKTKEIINAYLQLST